MVSAMLHNPELVLRLLNEIRFPNSPEPIGAEQFVRKWLGHIEDFTGIHDRRVCIFGKIKNQCLAFKYHSQVFATYCCRLPSRRA